MALNVDTQDLDNWPGNVKRVTLDQSSLILTGEEGDEQYVLSFATSAYSDNTDRDAIPTIYTTTFKTGWCKSSGLTGMGGKFLLTSGAHKLKINIDSTTNSGSGNEIGDCFYIIDLTIDGAYTSGEIIADNMQTKIRALASQLNTTDAGLELSYLNASVKFKSGRFFITSGSVGEYFNGEDRTSVIIGPVDGDGASTLLGFDLAITSRAIDAISVKEVVVTQPYTGGTGNLHIGPGTGCSAGDCMMITDGLTKKEYFTVLSGSTDINISLATIGEQGYKGITQSYTETISKVQLLREQDPEVVPNMFHTTVDSICRHGIKSIINQIDYSS